MSPARLAGRRIMGGRLITDSNSVSLLNELMFSDRMSIFFCVSQPEGLQQITTLNCLKNYLDCTSDKWFRKLPKFHM